MSPRARTAAAAAVGLLVAAFAASFLAQVWTVLRDTPGTPPAPAIPADDDRPRIEVLNAAGTPGIAREATRRLRARGFDVVYFGNAAAFDRDSSIVLDRIGNLDAARDVADALGIGAVHGDPDPERLLEVTVLLGKDWPPARPAEPPGWWARVSRLLRRFGAAAR